MIDQDSIKSEIAYKIYGGLSFYQRKEIKDVMAYLRLVINNKDEESLGIIFTYLMLETILLGKLMKLNPFDQPAVESIKKETKKFLS